MVIEHECESDGVVDVGVNVRRGVHQAVHSTNYDVMRLWSRGCLNEKEWYESDQGEEKSREHRGERGMEVVKKMGEVVAIDEQMRSWETDLMPVFIHVQTRWSR